MHNTTISWISDIHNFFGLALSSTVLLRLALALPADGSVKTHVHKLFNRQVKWDTSCQGKIPNDPKGRTYLEKASEAFSDAAIIANTAAGEKADGKVFTDSAAFQHYFSDKDDKNLVTQMMSTISANNIPDDSLHSSEGYTFTVSCGTAADRENCIVGAFAATNPGPSAPIMTLCDKFFDPNEAATKNDLASKEFIPNPKRTQDSWCKTGIKPNYYFVAGLTAFHEMTHLDLVGNKAGLPSVEDRSGEYSSHGTIDITETGSNDDTKKYDADKDYWAERSQPQDLKKNYKPARPATQNAESFAAAALEFYIQTKCANLKDGLQ